MANPPPVLPISQTKWASIAAGKEFRPYEFQKVWTLLGYISLCESKESATVAIAKALSLKLSDSTLKLVDTQPISPEWLVQLVLSVCPNQKRTSAEVLEGPAANDISGILAGFFKGFTFGDSFKAVTGKSWDEAITPSLPKFKDEGWLPVGMAISKHMQESEVTGSEAQSTIAAFRARAMQEAVDRNNEALNANRPSGQDESKNSSIEQLTAQRNTLQGEVEKLKAELSSAEEQIAILKKAASDKDADVTKQMLEAQSKVFAANLEVTSFKTRESKLLEEINKLKTKGQSEAQQNVIEALVEENKSLKSSELSLSEQLSDSAIAYQTLSQAIYKAGLVLNKQGEICNSHGEKIGSDSQDDEEGTNEGSISLPLSRGIINLDGLDEDYSIGYKGCTRYLDELATILREGALPDVMLSFIKTHEKMQSVEKMSELSLPAAYAIRENLPTLLRTSCTTMKYKNCLHISITHACDVWQGLSESQRAVVETQTSVEEAWGAMDLFVNDYYIGNALRTGNYTSVGLSKRVEEDAGSILSALNTKLQTLTSPSDYAQTLTSIYSELSSLRNSFVASRMVPTNPAMVPPQIVQPVPVKAPVIAPINLSSIPMATAGAAKPADSSTTKPAGTTSASSGALPFDIRAFARKQ